MKKILPKHLFIIVIFISFTVALTSCSQESSQINLIESLETTMPDGNEFNTISAVLLDKANQLPVISDGKLPDWHGTALTPEYFDRSINAKDIEDIANSGFNYVRVHYSYKEFFEESSLKPIESNLKKLDQVTGWGIEYGVHINVTLYELPGSRDDIMKNSEHYRQAIEVWEMLAKRYSNVPAAALSYNLLNEPGYEVFTEEEYAVFANELAEVIWQYDNKKIIVSDGMLAQGWDGAVASKPIDNINPKIVQALHFYPWHSLRRSAHLSLLHWPYDQGVTVNNVISSGGEPLKVIGDFPEGSEISIYIACIDNVNNGGTFILQADGTDIGQQSLDGIKPTQQTKIFTDEGNPDILKAEFGEYGNFNGMEINFKLQKSAETLALKVKGEENTRVYVRELMIRIPTETEGYYQEVDNTKKPHGFVYKKGKFRSVYIACTDVFSDQGSTVTIASDGSITSSPAFSEVDIFDLDTMKNYFKHWRNWADEHNVRIMCNEFSIPMALPKTERMAYLKSILEVLDANQLPWAVHCERVEGWGPVVLEHEKENGKLVLPPDNSYVHQNGYYIDQPALDLIEEYTSK